MTSNTDNSPRFNVNGQSVESWFLRANDPNSPRAIWIKSTVLCRADGTAIAEAWASVFDGDHTAAVRETVPLSQAEINADEDRLLIDIGGNRLELERDTGTSVGNLSADSSTAAGATESTAGANGTTESTGASGATESTGASTGIGGCNLAWELSFDRAPGSLGEPLSLLPSRRLIDAPIPKNKLLTPFPVAAFHGTVTWNGVEWPLSNWIGMQGHNWGAAHSPEYAWGQCVFNDSKGRPFAMVEGASGRIQLGPVTTPLLSLLTVRRDGHEYRFDRLVDLWRQDPKLEFPNWRLKMRGSDGQAELIMHGDPARMVCLGYDNPNGKHSYCLNSKTSQVTLRVSPINGDAFECHSEFGGALEFLQPTEHPLVQPVI